MAAMVKMCRGGWGCCLLCAGLMCLLPPGWASSPEGQAEEMAQRCAEGDAQACLAAGEGLMQAAGGTLIPRVLWSSSVPAAG